MVPAFHARDAPVAHVSTAELPDARHRDPVVLIEEQDDGSLILSLQVGGEKEILAWLYSFVPHVQVLEPLALREAFLDGLRQALEK